MLYRLGFKLVTSVIHSFSTQKFSFGFKVIRLYD